ncbi:unnamed protein product [Ostreobium quekettii]|uniref:Carbohydrate binding module family 25 domain-containing protein n=1 Tax=Ostreobium quekettii TaxID=121088 RepID=A0A8S1J6W8_9CHLO|nr:unnamed protein product [Ostreobium quekettii]|eukprot:evm.model.scf_633.3 EVM.evm.TU.scf_633.3   scf_633:48154-50498(-)
MMSGVMHSVDMAVDACRHGPLLPARPDGLLRCKAVSKDVLGNKTKRVWRVRTSATHDQVEEMKEFVEEAQKNILELNKSRLRALEDANNERHRRLTTESKFSELEARLADMESENNLLRTRLSALDKNLQLSQSSNGSTEKDAAGSGSSTAAEGTITLKYSTAWDRAYVHYNADGKGWTKSPGLPMEPGEGRMKTLSIRANTIEFVVNDGGQSWDHPNPYSENPGNYRLGEPGVYLLKSGVLKKQ